MVAFVEVRYGSGLQLSALRDHARGRLAAYKRPQYIFILEKIPAGPTGEILKVPLALLAEELIAKSIE